MLDTVRACYQMGVGAFGIQPSEFWDMSPEEFWWVFEFKRPRNPDTDFAGALTRTDVADLYDYMKAHDNG